MPLIPGLFIFSELSKLLHFVHINRYFKEKRRIELQLVNNKLYSLSSSSIYCCQRHLRIVKRESMQLWWFVSNKIKPGQSLLSISFFLSFIWLTHTEKIIFIFAVIISIICFSLISWKHVLFCPDRSPHCSKPNKDKNENPIQ